MRLFTHRSRAISGASAGLPAVILSACAALAQPGDAPPGNESITRHLERGGQPILPAPDRTEGEGPFDRLVIRGANLIDGTGAPPVGPVDIVIEGDRITEIRSVGNFGAPIDPAGRPDAGDHEIDAHGMYVLPGFINAHAHIHSNNSCSYTICRSDAHSHTYSGLLSYTDTEPNTKPNSYADAES